MIISAAPYNNHRDNNLFGKFAPIGLVVSVRFWLWTMAFPVLQW